MKPAIPKAEWWKTDNPPSGGIPGQLQEDREYKIYESPKNIVVHKDKRGSWYLVFAIIALFFPIALIWVYVGVKKLRKTLQQNGGVVDEDTTSAYWVTVVGLYVWGTLVIVAIGTFASLTI